MDRQRLNRVLQLTGFSDPVYAEAYVTVHQYDVVMDITLVNRTPETLQNLCLELATMGDLKLVERPQNYTLAPRASKQIRANIKVSSTETGAWLAWDRGASSGGRHLSQAAAVGNSAGIRLFWLLSARAASL